MLQSISNCGRKLNNNDILQLEEILGHKLPTDYVAFLLRHNGGVPIPDCHIVQNTEETNIGDVIGIECFFSIGGPDKDFGSKLFEGFTPKELTAIKLSDDILNNYEIFKRRMPQNLLPIGSCPCGDIICVSLYGDDENTIWYWDHEGEIIPPNWNPDEAIQPPDYSNCYKVADSFQALLDGLFEYNFENELSALESREDVRKFSGNYQMDEAANKGAELGATPEGMT